MKRRSSFRASPSHKRVSSPGSPSSVLLSSVQVDNDMNSKMETTNITQDRIEGESKNQIASSNRGKSVEENGDHEKAIMEFDLNAIPDNPPSSYAPFFIPQNDAVQCAAQASDTPIDVNALHSVIEVIDVGESPIREDNMPVDVVETTVQSFDNDIFVGRLSYSSNAEANIVPSSYAPSDVELVDDMILSLFLSNAAQVRYQSTGALSRTIVLGEDHDANGDSSEGPSTVLTLSPYQLEMPLTDFFKLESSHDTMVKNVTTTTEPEKQKSPERKKPEEPKESPFTCAVCWGPLKDETSTICGHIFCQICIKAAIKAQRKCPTCRRNLNRRNIHRVYLPT